MKPNENSFVSPTGRFVKPDPLSDIVVGLDGNVCLILITSEGGAGTGCSTRSAFFYLGPLNVMTSGGGGTESMVVAGAAADGVARLVVFGADGQQLRVPLRDNLFAARVALSQFPLRLVGYDKQGRVVAVRMLESGLLGTGLPPSAWTPTRYTIRTRGSNGATATLHIARHIKDFRCWRVVFSTGQSRRGCKETGATGPWVSADLVQQAGRDLFVIGSVRAPVELVKLRFSDGKVLRMRPVAGLYLFAIPRRYLQTERQLAFVRGYDSYGLVVQRAPVLFKRAQP